MSLKQRLKRLERDLARRAACEACRGEPAVRFVLEGDPEPTPCPACGRGLVFVICVRPDAPVLVPD